VAPIAALYLVPSLKMCPTSMPRASSSVAPFAVVIVVANVKDEAARKAGEELHDALAARGVDVLLDDRDERAGVKFKDADLVGYPVRVVAGKGVANGLLEVRPRRDAASAREVALADAADAVTALLAELRGAAQ
jgi:prolyl-tRNA synthetase